MAQGRPPVAGRGAASRGAAGRGALARTRKKKLSCSQHIHLTCPPQRDNGGYDGWHLIRLSTKEKNTFVITLCYKGKLFHNQVCRGRARLAVESFSLVLLLVLRLAIFCSTASRPRDSVVPRQTQPPLPLLPPRSSMPMVFTTRTRTRATTSTTACRSSSTTTWRASTAFRWC